MEGALAAKLADAFLAVLRDFPGLHPTQSGARGSTPGDAGQEKTGIGDKQASKQETEDTEEKKADAVSQMPRVWSHSH